MPLRLRLPRRLVGRGVAGDQREPLLPRVQAVAAQATPDPVVADNDPAPALAAQLARDPPRPEARVAEREGDNPFLNERRELVR
jgi:hypothetical protein